MDVKEAVKTAKKYVSDIFAEEGLTDLGLEEVERDDETGDWRVTLGFSRPWNTKSIGFPLGGADILEKRSYKMVLLRDDGTVLSLRQRTPELK